MDMNAPGLAYPKGPSRKTLKGRVKRSEATVKREVRAACVERDGYCRLAGLAIVGQCQGRSEWSHMAGHRRSQTMGRPADERHATAWTSMLCTKHGKLEEDDAIAIVPLTDRGLDGPIEVQWKAPKTLRRPA